MWLLHWDTKEKTMKDVIGKVCSICKAYHAITYFDKDKSIKSGYRSYCKNCSKKFRENNIENLRKG